MKKIAILAALTAFSGYAVATDNIKFEQHNLYVGGGLGTFSLSGWDSTIGYQVFAGYDLDFITLNTSAEWLNKLSFAAEVGYTTATYERTDFFGDKFTWDVGGLWSGAVAHYPINDQFKVGTTLGLDIGDNSGLLVGVNSTYEINDQFDVRAEYTIRPSASALLANVIYKF